MRVKQKQRILETLAGKVKLGSLGDTKRKILRIFLPACLPLFLPSFISSYLPGFPASFFPFINLLLFFPPLLLLPTLLLLFPASPAPTRPPSDYFTFRPLDMATSNSIILHSFVFCYQLNFFSIQNRDENDQCDCAKNSFMTGTHQRYSLSVTPTD